MQIMLYICIEIYSITIMLSVKFLRSLLVLLSLIVLPAAARGKELKRFIVWGTLVEADTTARVAVSGAAVSLSAANDTVSIPYKTLNRSDSTNITDSSGEFRLLVEAGRGDYMLTFDKEGYEPLVKQFKVMSLSQDIVWVGSLPMQRERHRRLDEVDVVATAIKMVVKGDTIVFNANAFNLAEGSMLDGLVKQLPGVTLEPNGQVKVNGRFVNSLLINGKDFFKGDPQVALQNLPAYTVQNVKVYDKADDDDYLTHASQKLSRREDEENLVMDVVLKREYSLGYLGQIEACYGTKDRYKGKIFGMGFSDRLRLAAFGNTNNLSDTDVGKIDGNEGRFEAGWYPTGLLTAHIGGLNYNYDCKRWKTDGSTSFYHETYDFASQTAAVKFFSGAPDLYERRATALADLRRHFVTKHTVKYAGDHFHLTVEPTVDYINQRIDRDTREATFTQQPPETHRNESLDSLFAAKVPERFESILLTRLRQRSLSAPGRLTAKVDIDGRIAPAEMRGNFTFELYGRIHNTWGDRNSTDVQHFGAANTSTARPLNNSRYYEEHSRHRDASGSFDYNYRWLDVGSDGWTNILEMTAGANYSYAHCANDHTLFNSPEGYEVTLPSLHRPEDFILNEENSYNSILNTHTAGANLSLHFSRSLTAPTKSGTELTYGFSASLSNSYTNENLNYQGKTDEHLQRHYDFLQPRVNLFFSTSNPRRFLSVSLAYRLQRSAVPFNLFLSERDTSNPLYVYVNNASGLRNPATHGVTFYLYRSGRDKYHIFYSLHSQFLMRDNAVGSVQRYNPQTGVTVSSPININGSWNGSASGTFSFDFGPGNCLGLEFNPNTYFSKTIDYVTVSAEPERQVMRSAEYNLRLSLSYKFYQGSVVSVRGTYGRELGRSTNPNVADINASRYHMELNGSVKLPWNMQLVSGLTMVSYRGYSAEVMNRTQWIWNASLSKSMLRGRLVFKVSANDILNQISNISSHISADARTEFWSKSLPRYVLASVIFRFNHNPKRSN